MSEGRPGACPDLSWLRDDLFRLAVLLRRSCFRHLARKPASAWTSFQKVGQSGDRFAASSQLPLA